MIDLPVCLSGSGTARTLGYENLLKLGYSRNRGVYRLILDADDEWAGLTIRAFWHTPCEGDPLSSLVENGRVEVPALVTAISGTGCVTFEGSDGEKTLTSADLRYRVGANSGTDDGTLPEPGPQGAKGDPGTGLTDTAKALLLALLAGETEDKDAALKALREEWGTLSVGSADSSPEGQQ